MLINLLFNIFDCINMCSNSQINESYNQLYVINSILNKTYFFGSYIVLINVKYEYDDLKICNYNIISLKYFILIIIRLTEPKLRRDTTENLLAVKTCGFIERIIIKVNAFLNRLEEYIQFELKAA